MIRVYIRKKPDRGSLVLYYDDPVTGREISKSAKTSDLGEAERAARDWENELQKFRGSDDTGWEWVKLRFIDEHCISVSDGTRSACVTVLSRYTRVMSPETVADVSTDTLSRYHAALLGEGLQPTTAAKDLRHLKLFLRWTWRMGIIQAVPHVPMPRTGKRRFMRGRPLTHAEYKLMLKNADAAYGKQSAPSWKRLLEMLWLSGLRIEEASQCSWEDPPLQVRLDAKPYPQLLFYGADIDGQKSGNDEAWPMPPDLAEWFERTHQRQRKGLVAPLYGVAGELVTNRADVSKAVARIGKAAGIVVSTENGKTKYASAHDLRRAFGTRWALQVPPVVLQKLMRHATLDTTMKYYVGIDSSEIGAVLWKGVSPKMSPGKGRKRA